MRNNPAARLRRCRRRVYGGTPPPVPCRSVRLPSHAYADGLYFVTIVAAGHRPLSGRIAGGAMRRSAFGDIAHDEWVRTGDVQASVMSDTFIVMPDHVHLLFGVVPTDTAEDHRHAEDHTDAPLPNAPTAGSRLVPPTTRGRSTRRFGTMARATVPVIVRSYKSAVTRAVNLAAG